jgi:hypothetical protein
MEKMFMSRLGGVEFIIDNSLPRAFRLGGKWHPRMKISMANSRATYYQGEYW